MLLQKLFTLADNDFFFVQRLGQSYRICVVTSAANIKLPLTAKFAVVDFEVNGYVATSNAERRLFERFIGFIILSSEYAYSVSPIANMLIIYHTAP